MIAPEGMAEKMLAKYDLDITSMRPGHDSPGRGRGSPELLGGDRHFNEAGA